MFEGLKGKILVLVLIIFAARAAVHNLHDPFRYKGPWYTVNRPVGWKVEEVENEVLFKSPKTRGAVPEAIFSIYGIKPEQAIFMEDFFAEVLEQLRYQKGELLDKGQIEIDGQVSHWTLFKNRTPPLAILTFYTVDDFNRLTKIQYIAPYQTFDDYREKFDAFKDSFQFKGIF
ncbi:MAG: hypothetical protein ACLFPX_02140 [Candidatus Omnitrophota bacterium]